MFEHGRREEAGELLAPVYGWWSSNAVSKLSSTGAKFRARAFFELFDFPGG
jgi:hypothetical protein